MNSSVHTRGYDDPLYEIYEQANTSSVNRTFGNANISWDPFDWLNVKEVLGADYYTDARLNAFPQSSSGQPTGSVQQGDYQQYQIDHNLTATMKHTFSPDAQASLTVGQNLNSRSNDQIVVTGTSLVAPQPFVLGNTTSLTTGNFQSLVHAERYFSSGQVFLFNQLNVEGSITNDGFSTFGTSSQRHWFPSGNVAWSFIQSSANRTGILNYGKLRFAYGEAGIEPPVYSTTQNYVGGGTVGDAGWGDGLFLNQGGNGGQIQGGQRLQTNLGPERTKEFETGVDLGLLDSHANASLTLYSDRTEGAIFGLPLPNSTGFSFITANAGTIRNRGIEASINYRPIMRSDLTWEIGLNWSKNENRLVNLSGNQFVDLGTGGGFTDPTPTAWYGQSVGVLRGEDFARCGRGLTLNGIDIDAGCGNAPKGALYIGSDGFPVLDPTERVIADGNPKWLGSLHSSVTWNKVTLSGLVNVRHGGQVWNGTLGALEFFGTSANTMIRGKDVVFGKTWFPGPVGGPGAGMSVLLDQDWFQGNGSSFTGPSAQTVEDGSYVKLREISVSYSLQQNWIKNWGFSSIDVRVAGRNLHTWTKYTGIDPEANLAGATALIQGVDYFNNPQTRSVVLSLGLNR